MVYLLISLFLLPLSPTHWVLSSQCFPGYSCVLIFLTHLALLKTSLEFLLELYYIYRLTGSTDMWRTLRHPNQEQEMLFHLFTYSGGDFFSSSYFLLSLHCLISKGSHVFSEHPFLSHKITFLPSWVPPTCKCLFHSRMRTLQLLAGAQSFVCVASLPPSGGSSVCSSKPSGPSALSSTLSSHYIQLLGAVASGHGSSVGVCCFSLYVQIMQRLWLSLSSGSAEGMSPFEFHLFSLSISWLFWEEGQVPNQTTIVLPALKLGSQANLEVDLTSEAVVFPIKDLTIFLDYGIQRGTISTDDEVLCPKEKGVCQGKFWEQKGGNPVPREPTFWWLRGKESWK